MVCNCYPERLGHCIIYQPPAFFEMFFHTIKGFIDPKTVSKMVFIRGDVSDGSENDVLLKSIIGDNWKVLSGADQPILRQGSSPGYLHDVYWPTVQSRVKEQDSRRIRQQASPHQQPQEDVLKSDDVSNA